MRKILVVVLVAVLVLTIGGCSKPRTEKAYFDLSDGKKLAVGVEDKEKGFTFEKTEDDVIVCYCEDKEFFVLHFMDDTRTFTGREDVEMFPSLTPEKQQYKDTEYTYALFTAKKYFEGSIDSVGISVNFTKIAQGVIMIPADKDVLTTVPQETTTDFFESLYFNIEN